VLSLVLAFVPLAASGHPESLSKSEIRIDGARASVALRFQALSLIEVRPELDANRDTQLDAGELAAGREAIEGYLLAGFRLLALEGEREAPLAGRLLEIVAQDPAELSAFELQNLDARLEFDAAAPLERAIVETKLFLETNPWHRDYCTLTWNEDEPVPHTFSASEPRWVFEPAHVRRPSVLTTFIGLGVTHILGNLEHPLAGSDHLAFLLALLVASKRLRTLLGVVTSFTVAHSITLALAALGVVHVPSRFVELAIALSIAYVACDTLLRHSPRNPWLEAFLFGLLHGLGFAGFLSEALANEPLIVTALLGFNLGVEIGQLSFVLVCVGLVVLVFRAHRRRAAQDSALGLVPAPVRTVVSAAVALAGFYWFFERAGWLPWA
jgi:hydrogenase/urease accessory protein HupE